MRKNIFIFFGIFVHIFSLAQQNNQASGVLLLEYDAANQHYGLALMSNELYGESFKWYVFENEGFVAFTGANSAANLAFFEKEIEQGNSLKTAWENTKLFNQGSLYGQMGLISKDGSSEFVNGQALSHQLGYSEVAQKGKCMVFGYQLSDQNALKSILQNLENHINLPIGDRLIKTLEAGKTSQVLLGKIQYALLEEVNPTWIQIKSRESNALEALIKQWEFRKSVIKLNDALDSFHTENTTTAKNQLETAVEQFPAMEGIHSPLLKAYILLGQEEKVLQILQNAIQKEPSYNAFLADYYILKTYDTYSEMVDSQGFSVKEWNRAIKSYLEFDKIDEAIYWINQTLKKYPDQAYTYFLMGEAYALKRNRKLARKSYQKALKLDADLIEAKLALENITK